ncbi:MAG: hypothetical protein HY465_01420 [Deltaproteobacteria bacterium]|nr:hypothetical protein [Deltaproteobacteria bacterium]
MVATAILTFALVAVMTAQGNTLLTSRRAEVLTTATILAKQKMADVELELNKAIRRGEFPEEKTEGGKFDEPFEEYRWKTEIKRVSLPAPAVGEDGSLQAMVGKQLTEEIGKNVREVRLTVIWDESGEEQSFDVVTHIVHL